MQSMDAILDAAFAKAGVQVEYVFLPWTRALVETRDGKWDATAAWGRNAERDRPVSSCPSSAALPLVGRISCRSALPTVVFPQPDSPTNASVRPRLRSSETPSTALTWPTARCRKPRRIGK